MGFFELFPELVAVNFAKRITFLNKTEFEKYVGDGLSLDGTNDRGPYLSFTFRYSDQTCFSFKKYIKNCFQAWFREFFTLQRFDISNLDFENFCFMSLENKETCYPEFPHCESSIFFVVFLIFCQVSVFISGFLVL